MPGIPNFRVETAEECEKIAVGDRVRSYDFEFRDDCYIEGLVEDDTFMWEGCNRYVIRVERMVSEGVENPTWPGLGGTCFPPVNGTRNAMGGFCNGVRKVQP